MADMEIENMSWSDFVMRILPKKAELIAYEDLGAEALRKLYVEDMPLVVIIDSEGNNLYEEGRAAYLAKQGK